MRFLLRFATKGAICVVLLFAFTILKAATPQLRFATISDTHVGSGSWNARLTHVFDVLKAQTPKLDAIFVSGDATDYGTEAQFQSLASLVSTNLPASGGIPIYFALGNHDLYSLGMSSSFSFMQTYLGQKPNQFITIKGYPFIMCSFETTNQYTCFGTESIKFLTDTLAYAATNFPGKPIFLFIHAPNEGTAYGSYVIGGGDSWGTPNIKTICEQYPQIVAISGHSHYPIGDERSIHQNKFTSINDGSCNYLEVETGKSEGIHPPNSSDIQEGVVFTQQVNNDFSVKRLSFTQNVEIKTPWTLKYPYDGTAFTYKNRTSGAVPAFSGTASIVVNSMTATTCNFTYSQATDDDMVSYYEISIIDKITGVVINTFTQFSQFYLNALMPATLTWNATGLSMGKTYAISIKAVDSFGGKSSALVSADVQLPIDPIIIPSPTAKWTFDIGNPLKASIGSDLIVNSALGGAITEVNGITVTDGAVLVPKQTNFKALHGLTALGADTKVNKYSLIIDFKIPATGVWHTFYQTDLSNTTDATVFLRNSDQAIGIQNTGYGASGIVANKWYRLIVSADLANSFKYYLDGKLISTSSVPAKESKFALDVAGLLLFGDEDGEDNSIIISEVSVYREALSDVQCDAFAGVGTNPVSTDLALNPVGVWDFNESNYLKATKGNDLVYNNTSGGVAATTSPYTVAGISATDDATLIPTRSNLKCIHGLTPASGEAKVNKYTISMDIKLPAVGVWHSLLQTDLTNSTDANIFLSNTNQSIGLAMYGYSATNILANTWYRLVISADLGTSLSYYLNGVALAAPTSIPAKDSNFGLAPTGFLLFGDNDGEDNDIQVSNVTLYKDALTASQVASLGSAGTSIVTKANAEIESKNIQFSCFPNPLTENSVLSFTLPVAQTVIVSIYDVHGNLVFNLPKRQYAEGFVTIPIQMAHLPKGIYFATLTLDGSIQTIKVIK